MKNYLPFFLLFLFSCEKTNKSVKLENRNTKSDTIFNDVKSKTNTVVEFTKFKPDSASVNIKNFSDNLAYRIGDNYLLTGYFEPIDGKIRFPDTENDYGKRLLFLNSKKEIKYKSFGAGDTYLFHPYFYKNNYDDRIVIVCQLAFEYFFGGEAFLLENNKIKYLGNIDVESNDMETSLVKILKVKAQSTKLTFSFASDSLLLKPGNEDIMVKNNNIRYEYDGKSFRFIK